MQIDFDPLPLPPDGDVLECRTWSRLTWRAYPLELTRVWDRTAHTMRDSIFVPLFPLAQWIVTNWWFLLYEPSPLGESIPRPGEPVTAEAREWLRRHCVRAALPGYASPFACIFSEGRTTAITMRADPRGRYLSTPVEFIEDETSTMEYTREYVSAELAKLVAGVLKQIDGIDDPRATALRANWEAICNVSPSEAEFCRAAGRLGFDPYDSDDWSSELLEWLENSPVGELDRAFVADLLEVPGAPDRKPAYHREFSRMADNLHLEPSPHVYGPAPRGTAHDDGYALASWLRTELKLTDAQPLSSLDEASSVGCGAPLLTYPTPIPDGPVLSVVGWRTRPGPGMAMRPLMRPESSRFLQSRGLYMVLRGTVDGPRLVTDARTWDQRASRAFGAELLAPRAGVMQRLSEEIARVGEDEAEIRVAEHFAVTPMVIRHQRENFARTGEGR